MRVLLAAVAVLCVMPSAAATHMGWYAQFPVEHDDQGRSEEPDGAATAVLGVALRNCVIGTSLSQPGCTTEPAGEGPLAPGCSDDAGRQPSGLCGLWTVGLGHPWLVEHEGVPAKTIGSSGPGCQHSPGAFTRGCRAVRFLDLQANLHFYVPNMPGTNYVQLNRKVADTGLGPRLAATGLGAGDALVADTGLWAWYGTWLDKNGNGVIDHLGASCDFGACGPDGGVSADNEFVWIGSCLEFSGTPPPVGQKYCKVEDIGQFPLWIWPGSHHAYCATASSDGACYLGSDLPGRELVCFAETVGYLETTMLQCPGDLSTYDEDERRYFGDPLLGEQHRSEPDGTMRDRTGDADPALRHWVYDYGWQTRFYDASLLVTTIILGGPTSQRWGAYDFGAFHALDVDHYAAPHPLTDALLQQQLKPLARGTWVSVRDNYIPLQNTTDGTRNQRALDVSPWAAPVDDAIINPGWSKEPNHALDAFPGVVFDAFPPSDPSVADVDERRAGWLNDYRGHRDAWHAFADVTGQRLMHTNLAWRTPVSGNCMPMMCVTGGGTFTSNQYLSPLANAERQRTLEPGLWVFTGLVGAWRDRSHVVVDEVIDIAALLAGQGIQRTRTDYVVPPDGWIGNIVNITGTWKYRGYPGPGDAGAPTCTIGGVRAERYFAECSPYYDAQVLKANPYGLPFEDPGFDLEQPQSSAGGEFVRIFPERTLGNQHIIEVYPAGPDGDCATAGTWTVPVVRWNGFAYWPIGNTDALVDFTGKSGAEAVLRLRAGISGTLGWQDVVLLPVGNLGQTVCTRFATSVVVALPGRGIVVDEPLREVDVYVPWPGALATP